MTHHLTQIMRKDSKMKKLLLWVIGILLYTHPLLSFEIDKVLPTVQIRDANQNLVRVNENIGIPIVLFAFNLKCETCDTTIQSLMEEHTKRGESLQIFLINTDLISKKQLVLDKLAEMNCDLPVLFDKNQDYIEGVTYPYTVLVDANGFVRDVVSGDSSANQTRIKNRIESFFAVKKEPKPSNVANKGKPSNNKNETKTSIGKQELPTSDRNELQLAIQTSKENSLKAFKEIERLDQAANQKYAEYSTTNQKLQNEVNELQTKLKSMEEEVSKSKSSKNISYLAFGLSILSFLASVFLVLRLRSSR